MHTAAPLHPPTLGCSSGEGQVWTYVLQEAIFMWMQRCHSTATADPQWVTERGSVSSAAITWIAMERGGALRSESCLSSSRTVCAQGSCPSSPAVIPAGLKALALSRKPIWVVMGEKTAVCSAVPDGSIFCKAWREIQRLDSHDLSCWLTAVHFVLSKGQYPTISPALGLASKEASDLLGEEQAAT